MQCWGCSQRKTTSTMPQPTAFLNHNVSTAYITRHRLLLEFKRARTLVTKTLGLYIRTTSTNICFLVNA